MQRIVLKSGTQLKVVWGTMTRTITMFVLTWKFQHLGILLHYSVHLALSLFLLSEQRPPGHGVNAVSHKLVLSPTLILWDTLLRLPPPHFSQWAARPIYLDTFGANLIHPDSHWIFFMSNLNCSFVKSKPLCTESQCKCWFNSFAFFPTPVQTDTDPCLSCHTCTCTLKKLAVICESDKSTYILTTLGRL